ncbi:tripartite tricarboxylate transporter permease [Luteitalea sp. TBR-22]|uniref:tripartite tricarboxylate transporter permease n=1 Tax=Luteitalea sp. TBR-22 TaxID=2802971 RepID=UPI00351D905D
MLQPLAAGFATALATPQLLACLIGALLGTAVGVLPGLGPITTIALLLPFIFAVSPTAAVIMLAGIYYGAQYGGSITAILVNVPGEASSAITCVDGHAMARQGRARFALSVAAISSFVGGTVGTLLVAVAAQPLSRLASYVQAADYASLMVFGLVAAVLMGRGAIWKSLLLTVVGVILGAVGTDVASGEERWTLGIPALYDGIGFVPVAIGLFGLAEIIRTLASGRPARLDVLPLSGRAATADERWRAAAATLRGTATGAVLGMLPGGGPVLASFASYGVERAWARHPHMLGRGAVEGVAGPEAANNAAAQTSFVPLLTLGLPSNPAVALLLGALIVHGVQPGPGIIAQEPTLFWGLVASMWVGNAMLLVLNLPLASLWARVAQLPYDYLYPATIVLSCAGAYAVGRNVIDLWIAAVFGVVGWLLRRWRCDPSPLLLGFILSRPLEENLGRALAFSAGDATIFLRRPLSAALLGVAAALTLMAVRRPRPLAESEE